MGGGPSSGGGGGCGGTVQSSDYECCDRGQCAGFGEVISIDGNHSLCLKSTGGCRSSYSGGGGDGGYQPPPPCDSYNNKYGPYNLYGCNNYWFFNTVDCNGQVSNASEGCLPCNNYTTGPSYINRYGCSDQYCSFTYDCNNNPVSQNCYMQDNYTCPSCTWDDNNWQDYTSCSVSCGSGTKTLYNDGTDHGKGDCYRQYRWNVPCSGPPCCDSNSWSGWSDTGSSSITGCQQRTYQQARTNQCGTTEYQNVNRSDSDTSQCPGCYVTRDWYDTANCPGDGYCGGTKHQHRDVFDPYGKGGCPNQDQDVACPSDHQGAWSGWDNDNGQSKIIGCRRRRYYRYRTNPCGGRQDGDDGNGGYRDADDGDTSQCHQCTITRDWYDTTSCPGNGNCGGTKHQKRDVSDPDRVGGCPSTDQDVSCPSDGNNNWSSWTNQSSSITGCKERTYVQIRTNQCGQSQTQNVKAADADTSKCGTCTYGAWTPSGNPTVTGCKTASQAQSRTAVDNGLGDCGPTTQTVTVPSTDTSKCAPCTYGTWTPTGDPTITGCKTASQTQTRTAVDNGKGDCGPTTQTVTVPSTDTSKCAPCTYGTWTPTGDPTITGCKTASQTQTRTAVDNGKGDCGPTTQSVPVPSNDISQCPPCQYSDWVDSSPCTAPCNGGTKTQSRTVLNSYGRGDCNIGLIQTIPCNTQSCAPCTYGAIDTSTLTPCSTPCGGGTQSGKLLVTNSNGNSSCSPMTSTQSCNTLPCAPPIHYHSIPPPVGRLTPVFSNFEIPKYRIRPPAPKIVSTPVASNVYAPFAPANSMAYSSCQENDSLLDSDSLDKFKDLILNAVSNYQKNISCH
jgi:Thrombospondin type 1 domain